MNLTLNKIVRIAALLCLCAMLLVGCKHRTHDIEGADQVCVSGAYADSYMYVITDPEVVAELSEMYNSIKYVETDATINAYDGERIYNLTFNNGNTTLGTIIVDNKLNFAFSAGDQVYHIESEFDFERFEKLLVKE